MQIKRPTVNIELKAKLWSSKGDLEKLSISLLISFSDYNLMLSTLKSGINVSMLHSFII